MSKLRVALVATCLLVLGLVICPQSPRIDADRLLRDVLRAQHKLNYEATPKKPYEYGRQANDPRADVFSIEASGQPPLGAQKHTSVFYGKEIHSTIEISHEGVESSGDRRLELLVFRNYIPVVEGTDRIAGKDTWVLRLKPKVKHRPWKQLWVDKKTCAIMASRDWTAQNTLKRSMKTTSIRFVRPPLVPAVSGKGFPETTNAMRHSRNVAHAPMAYVPTGFELTSFESNSHWVYSDGLYSISIFANQPGTRESVHDKPLDWGQGLIYTTRRGGRQIAVVADLPPDEIARIAQSFTH